MRSISGQHVGAPTEGLRRTGSPPDD